MFRPNENFNILPPNYLFSEVARRVADFRSQNPGAGIIRMDIGDVSLPLPQAAVSAMRKAVGEMAYAATFRGYGPEQGYEFLRRAICDNDYKGRGLDHISPDDIFISDGAKSDLGNIGDLFGSGLTIAVCNPGYPVYVDANVIDGNAGILRDGRWSRLVSLECPAESDFKPTLPTQDVDVIYLCFPCNPTGVALSVTEIQEWVDYALAHDSLIIFDSAYEAYVSEPGIARSIYEAEGAEKCAIEIRSFSKTAGFTGLRCGYTVVPAALRFAFSNGETASLRNMWNRRQSTKFNGVGYPVQRAAEALFSPEGQAEIRHNVSCYLENARILRDTLESLGFETTGGINSPYVWFRDMNGKGSWELFDLLLHECHLSSTPGVGFGSAGEGCIRFTGFNSRKNTLRTAERLKEKLL